MNFKVDLRFQLPILVIGLLGTFIIASVNQDLLFSHLVSFSIGIMLFGLLSQIRPQLLRAVSLPLYFLLIIGLIFLFTQPALRGAQRWLVVGSRSVQVAELGKPVYLLALAGIASGFGLKSGRGFTIFAAFGLLPVFLILKQPDLGDSILYLLVWVGILFAAFVPFRYITILIVAGALILPFSWGQLEGYQKERVFSFVNPQYDPQGIGYNAAQALIAAGSGGLAGRGIGQGTQSHLRFLPESHTDFIFASLVEELGFAGGFLLLSAYAVLFYSILRSALFTDLLFNRLVFLGVFTQIFTAVFINAGMNLGLVPITGITLPLFSYGGSSIVGTLASLGLAQSIMQTRRAREVVIR